MFRSIDRKGVVRFFKYTSVGLGTFIFDLALLYALTEWFFVEYLVSTIVSFVIAVSLNFFISSRVVFQGFTRNIWHAYVHFLGAAAMAAIAITLLMYVAVDLLGLYYIFARIGIAAIIGFCNYLFNLYATFEVDGKHH